MVYVAMAVGAPDLAGAEASELTSTGHTHASATIIMEFVVNEQLRPLVRQKFATDVDLGEEYAIAAGGALIYSGAQTASGTSTSLTSRIATITGACATRTPPSIPGLLQRGDVALHLSVWCFGGLVCLGRE